MEKFLKMSNISKSFSGVEVLHGVDFEVLEGEVHALIGENGAGKSTLMKILMGVYPYNQGEIVIHGIERFFHSPKDAGDAGLAMIHQELAPILDMTVAENIFVGKELSKFGFIQKKKQNKQASEILQNLGLTFPPTTLMRNLSISEMQMVEIAKNVSFGAKLVIMDEPTSAITEIEVEQLFKVIKLLKKRKISIVYISHRLEELFEVSDRITVLRDGNLISTLNTQETDKNELIRLMVGREIKDVFPPCDNVTEDVCLSVENFNRKGEFENISFELYRGERLGIAGLMGAGRSELVQTIFGERLPDTGQVEVNGQRVKIGSPKDAIKLKIALITEDRKRFGLNLLGTVQDNLTHIIEKKLSPLGFFKVKEANSLSAKMVKELNIRTTSLKQLTGSLSGGNQQKIVLGKWLLSDIDIFIFDEPTRGIDVGAKREIYRLINHLSAEKKGIIIISSEMPELIGLSDRILVLHEGRCTGELTKEAITQENIMRLASGI
jgi:ABC-type sugar transport system ATPase subunit